MLPRRRGRKKERKKEKKGGKYDPLSLIIEGALEGSEEKEKKNQGVCFTTERAATTGRKRKDTKGREG